MARKAKTKPKKDYKPMPGLATYLVNLSPKMGTPEMDMVIYWQWVHRCVWPFCRSVAKAWRDLGMTKKNAQKAIELTIVPMEIYPDAQKRADMVIKKRARPKARRKSR